MFLRFIYLEWKAFLRAASFKANLGMKILLGFLALYFTLLFLASGIGVFYVLQKMKLDPLATVNAFLIYYFLFDLGFRLLMQKIPVMNIRPLLNLPFKRRTIVHFALGKTVISYFNIMHGFFFIPFSAVLIYEGYDAVSVILWNFGILALVYINNFLNIVLSNKDQLFGIFIFILALFGGLQYYNYFNITLYCSPFFDLLFHSRWMFLIPLLILVLLYYYSFHFFKNELYLDAGLALKGEIAKTEDLTWLNQFGTLGTFLKNDIKLIKRNKRSKTTVVMSVLFLFYGFFFFFNPTQPKVMHVFAGIFVSGGFLFTFGQFVPSWDSSYYQLMMTQNVSYREYLQSKWWLIVIGTFISTILATFYLYFSLETYMNVVAGAIYNIGLNSYLVLLSGAYTKTPIDLANSSGAFGDKKAFNTKTMLLSIPKLLLPLLLYGLGSYLMNPTLGLGLVALIGLIGFSFKNKVFQLIEKIYKREKYKTIAAYKQKS